MMPFHRTTLRKQKPKGQVAQPAHQEPEKEQHPMEEQPKLKRGRPPKNTEEQQPMEEQPKRKRGRPKKIKVVEEQPQQEQLEEQQEQVEEQDPLAQIKPKKKKGRPRVSQGGGKKYSESRKLRIESKKITGGLAEKRKRKKIINSPKKKKIINSPKKKKQNTGHNSSPSEEY
jgi:hypothetical protein